MKILQVSSASTFAGGERHVVDLINSLAARGHELFAAVRHGSPLTPHLRIPSENIKALSLRNAFDAQSALSLAKLVKRHHIDVIHAHMARDYSLAAYAARQNASTKFVVTRHVLFPLSRFHKRTLARASRVIAVSAATARHLKEQDLLPADRIAVIRNGIDLEKFQTVNSDRTAYRHTLQVPENCMLVGSIGELRQLKRHDDFIRAAAIVSRESPSAYFVLAGSEVSTDSEERTRLQKLVGELGLTERFRFLGWLGNSASLLSSLDVFVSASETESFGLVIAEAMAAGVAVVSTATEGARELTMEGETGLLVPVGAVDQIAQEISSLLRDPNRRKQLASQAQRIVAEQFSLERMIDDVERLYEELIS